MFNLSDEETKSIDGALEEKLSWAKDRKLIAEQLALDASRLLSCTEDRLQEYAKQGFFKRCWSTLSGKTGELARATQADLIEMQKYAWRYINLLQERDLMLAHTVVTVKNNLMSLAIEQVDVKKEITRLAERVYDRFVTLEKRVDALETSHRIHGWLLTLDTYDYGDLYPEGFRFLRVINDFYLLKPSSWSAPELRYLQKALKEVGIDPKKQVGVSQFIDGIIGDVNERGYDVFSTLVPSNVNDDRYNEFVIDAVSSPAFSALYKIKEDYNTSSKVIRSLQRRHEMNHAEAIKSVLKDFIAEMGVETDAELPLKDLATEILGCLSLTQRLSESFDLGEIQPSVQTKTTIDESVYIFSGEGDVSESPVKTWNDEPRVVRETQENTQHPKDGPGFEVVWTDVRDTPFYPKDIESVASNVGRWFLLASGKGYYSDDGLKWSSYIEKVKYNWNFNINEAGFDKITYINGEWLLYNDFLPYIASSEDCFSWFKVDLPDGVLYPKISFYDNKWLLISKENKKFSYTKKGIIFDSKEEDTYNSVAFYTSSSLRGVWTRWSDPSNWDRGVSLDPDNFAVINGNLVGTVGFDRYYASLVGKIDRRQRVMYLSASGKWDKVIWPKEIGNNMVLGRTFYSFGNKGVCLDSGRKVVLFSENGTEWQIAIRDVSVRNIAFEVGGILCIPLEHNPREILISTDWINFSKITLSDDGSWSHFASDGKKILAVYRDFEGDYWMRMGEIRPLGTHDGEKH